MIKNHEHRSESDYLGTVEIPQGALYGINTVRGVKNLTVSRRSIGSEREFVRAFALCKWSAALANRDVGVLDNSRCDALVKACQELAEGLHDGEMIVDFMEGSGGTSSNMNVNEILANRAQQLLGGKLGMYDQVHPNDHVNRSQSTNDVYPTAMKIATHAMLGPLILEVQALANVLRSKSVDFADILHLGRTCLQDAQPIMLGQVFEGYAALSSRLERRLTELKQDLAFLPLGGTAIGTGFGAPRGYKSRVYAHLRDLTGNEFQPAENSFDSMQNIDVFSRVSAELRTCATSLAKVASDLILLSSGPNGGLAEVELPAIQAGSSIMPGKINPVLPMSMVQISFAVVGNDVCIAQANQAGQLEINHFEPVVADRLFDSINLLCKGIQQFRTNCVAGLRANKSANEAHLLSSTALATALIPKLGFAQVSMIVRESSAQKTQLLDVLHERGILSRDEAVQLTRQSTELDI